MSTPRRSTWRIEPHTRAKHEILRRYLGVWLRILATRFNRLVYVDGFCGPGRYEGGELGSPLVALEAARGLPEGVRVELHFTDWDGRRIEHLKLELGLMDVPEYLEVHAEQARFDEYLSSLLDRLEGPRMPPMFVFVDPFGFSNIPYTLLQRLLAHRSTEVLITFSADAINRFLQHPNEGVTKHILDALGIDSIRDILAGDPENRIQAIRDLYQRQLRAAARFVRYFEMRNRRGRIVYYMFFASNNPRGHVKMKDAMWKVDPDGEFRFSDATDANQSVLFSMDVTRTVANLLLGHFGNAAVVQVGQILDFINDETGFLEKHAKEALKLLEKDSDILVDQIKTSGKARRKGTFPADAVIRFPGSKSDNHG